MLLLIGDVFDYFLKIEIDENRQASYTEIEIKKFLDRRIARNYTNPKGKNCRVGRTFI